jgi:pyruvate dehydrogenase phosphatase
MCSDGLLDLYDENQQRDSPEYDLNSLASSLVKKVSESQGNAALHLLRDALGGSDKEKVSRMLTVEMSDRWMDDTTILVQRVL